MPWRGGPGGVLGRSGVGDSKGHDQGLEEAVVGAQGRLPFVAFLHPDEVVRPGEGVKRAKRGLEVLLEVGLLGAGVGIGEAWWMSYSDRENVWILPYRCFSCRRILR